MGHSPVLLTVRFPATGLVSSETFRGRLQTEIPEMSLENFAALCKSVQQTSGEVKAQPNHLIIVQSSSREIICPIQEY
jgi:hypothetical protein